MTLCLLGSLYGCATSAIELPEWQLPPAATQVTRPLPLPPLPDPLSSTADSVTFSTADFQALLAYAQTAEGNQDIAQANADALVTLSQAYNALIEAGKAQRQFAQIREEQLRRERRERAQDNWFHRAVIALGVLVAL